MANREPDFGNGKICYLEIPANNVAESSSFFEKVFGWELRKRSGGETAFDDGVGQVSGMWVTGRKPMTEVGIVISIMVDDAEATVELIKASGGKIVQPIGMDAPEITARFTDPAGNIFGIYQHRG